MRGGDGAIWVIPELEDIRALKLKKKPSLPDLLLHILELPSLVKILE